MGKLGVGVGDEFPADDVRREEGGEVHYHRHYYSRRRGGFLRVILWLMLIGALFRGFDYLLNPDRWGRHYYGWGGWRAEQAWGPYAPLAGVVVAVAVIGGALWLLRCRDERGPR